MTITSSLNAGVMGLNVNATRLAAISNNIANSATYGYKRADVNFTSLVVNQSASVYSAGGVQAQAIRNVSDAGSLISTGRATDIAVNGGGMIPVTNVSGLTQPGAERDFMMVPTGAFKPDAEGYLRTESGLYLLGWEMDANGDPVTGSRSSTTGLVPVNTTAGQFAAEVTNRINLSLNLPGDLSLAPVGETFDLPIEYFDQLGLPQTLNANFTRNAGDWSVVINDRSTGAPVQVAAFDVQFNANGTLDTITPGAGAAYNTTSGNVSLTLPSGPIEMFVGTSGTSGGLSQIGSGFQTQNVSANGSPAGELQSVEFAPDGSLEAIYNTGARRVIFQIPVAAVSNADGLTARGNQAYSVSRESGDVYLWDAGDGPSGELVGYSLMESNTDIAAELTSLIETQRAYSSNAKIVQTVDEMLQETTNLKR
ncbi:flagellar hook protein FlgE [Algimonas ampicilliniresistens]|jgi:flagellar hook protein FlgE|uniref:Flagellar hook protein FlgE n=1 Tax=Algimonas ampicilliniresistens TaxID=1298735 RepID=A0ABQ5VA81_9PROT|nr:flagellar hook-basal body complex protein [Algimonas ampicilliniresistens]GLQ24343.1 flagellar hook protein FlgE [Algimonas ampicilliniresistens]